MLTPRENFVRFLKNESYEWLPTSGDQRRFAPAFIPDNVARGLVVQQSPFPEKLYGGKDMFGVEWYYQADVKGSMEKQPLFSDPDMLYDWRDNLVFPDLNKMDWEGCAKENEEYLNTDKLLVTTIYTGFFERLVSLLGFENAAIALLDEELQEETAALFDALAEYYINFGKHLHKYFNIEYIEFHDDWGSQNSTMFSPEIYRLLIKPYLKKMVDGLHADGIFVEQHSCGFIESLIPDLIETGVDTWLGQAINDKEKLVCLYGDKFKFAVSILVPQPFEDATILETVLQLKKQYSGKRVWFALPWTLPPEKKEMLGCMMRSM